MAKYHSIYIWGAQGELVNQLSNLKIRAMEQNESTYLRVINFINMLRCYSMLSSKTRAFDCSGLICWALVMAGVEKEGFDMTSDDLAKRYPKTKKLRKGCLVHRPGHIGAYIGYNHIVESKGRDYGVVISPFDSRDWDDTYADPFTKEVNNDETN